MNQGVIPVWARTGFSEREPRMPHVVGRAGRIAALIFGFPLHAPPGGDRNNKILWVGKELTNRPADLLISAQRMRGNARLGAPVHRVVPGGPGPSIVDLPRPGCWRMTLHWGSRSDELDLMYRSS